MRARVEARLRGAPDPATHIGRFVVLERLGAGGMGVVFSAFDPQLDRKVAIKLLFDRRADLRERARLLAEAKAMAKLAHPNVVGVYEVGEHAGRVFIAMELVHGRTLRGWIEERPRTWRELLAMYLQAGRGLAAAHAAGIVHRDFKPDNVLVGEDGRARVLDFGLARLVAQPSSDDVDASTSASDASITKLTRTGAVLGTPAYMSPEQIEGGEVDELSDEFAFCIAMWEAFAGERPFAGTSVQALFGNVRRGELRKPRRAGLPGWIEAVLRRGLAADRGRRHPSMAALLAALERGAARRRTLVVVGVLGAVTLVGVGTAAAMEGLRRHERGQAIAACEQAGAGIDELWNDDARTRLRGALVATGASFAETTVGKVMPWIDAQAEAWRAARVDACLDATVLGVWDTDTLDRSLWCLDDRRLELEATLAVLLAADSNVVEKAVTAAAELTKVDACRDPDLLARLSPPAPEHRDEIRSVRAELARVVALEHAGKFEAARAAVVDAIAHAEALGWGPLTARLRLRQASLHERLAEHDAAETELSAAYFEGARIGAWDVAAEAATDLVFVVGERGHRLGEAIAWSRHAELALEYEGDRTGIKEAHRKNGLAVSYAAAGDFARARALHEETLALEEAAHGHDHPNVAVSLHNLGNVLVDVGELTAAEPLYQRALGIFEASLGPDHPDVGSVYNALGVIAFQKGDAERARTLHERGIAIIEQALGRDHPSVAGHLYNFSNVLAALGDYARARELQERALHVFETSLGPEHPNVAAALSGLATTLWETGEHELARAALERAFAINEKVLGPDHPALALSLDNLAQAYTGTGDREGAVALWERALTIYELQPGVQNGELESRFGLAKNLAKLGREPARARALAESARDGWKAEGPGKAELLAEVEAWLKEH